MPDMKHPGPWTPWRQFGENDDIGGVADANGKLVFSASGAGELQFSDREAERLALAAPESFALVVEFLCAILPQMPVPQTDAVIGDFRARCRRLVTRVLAQPSPAPTAEPTGRPSYEELAEALRATADELDAVETVEFSRSELAAARAILARIEQEPR